MKEIYFSLGFVIFALSIWSCRDDDFSTDNSISLDFSVDTLRLDTVFTERGSATYRLKVYNHSEEHTRIESIKLINSSGFFRLNIDGINANELTDIPIYANDSIYIFCEVTIDPDQPLSVSPFIIEDRIDFLTNGNTQSVYLEAWGQNANYFPSRASQKNVTRLTCNNNEILWDDEKPYVVYGVVIIDSCLLRIAAGRKIYVHGGVVNNDLGIYNDGIIYTINRGKVRAEGTLEEPIIIQDDRLEPAFEDIPGQWAALRIGFRSTGNIINHTIIKNSIVGIQVDSLGEVILNNVEIYNTAGSGVTAVNAILEMNNCLVYENGGSGVSIIQGGNTQLNYCTIGNFGNESPALSLNNFRCYDALCQVVELNPLNCTVQNCILVGDDVDEIFLIDGTNDSPQDFIFTFNNCLYKANDLPEDFPEFLNRCIDCIELDRNSSLFIDRLENDFHLDSLSQVEGLALPISIMEDKDGNVRDAVMPDIGCFEYIQ